MNDGTPPVCRRRCCALIGKCVCVSESACISVCFMEWVREQAGCNHNARTHTPYGVDACADRTWAALVMSCFFLRQVSCGGARGRDDGGKTGLRLTFTYTHAHAHAHTHAHTHTERETWKRRMSSYVSSNAKSPFGFSPKSIKRFTELWVNQNALYVLFY